MRALVLGGTGEGRVLAGRLAPLPGVDVVTSLAGRVTAPRLPVAGTVRTGGFGGADGLASYLVEARIEVVVDATHPFAARITEHAVTACRRLGLPLLVVRRPGWTPTDGDDWRRVPDLAAAARAVATTPPGAVLLTVGRQGLGRFARDGTHHYVIRSVDPPDDDPDPENDNDPDSGPDRGPTDGGPTDGGRLPPRRTIVLARGPFSLEGELALLREHGVTLLVTKDSGGDSTAPKLAAARELDVPVIMVDRPPLPPGVRTISSVDEAVSWVQGHG